MALRFTSGSTGPFDGPDEWKLEAVSVKLGGATLVSTQGLPLKHFKQSDARHEISLRR
jgi:hypothetical protein